MRVMIVCAWSNFNGCVGWVEWRDPLMVRLDGEAAPLRFGAECVVQISEPRHITAGD